jgi:hypothetical protein
MSEEQRKYLRFGCVLPAEVAMVEEKAHIISEAKIDEFSREGIRLKMSFNLKQGSTIKLNVRHPKTEETVPVYAEIIWSRLSEDSVELGLKIKEMETAAKSEILECIYEEWREEKQDSSPSEDSK